jgi:nuclear transport factor 2 (NTF2) superfamily protein
MNARPPLPPFTAETAIEKVRIAEDPWKTRASRTEWHDQSARWIWSYGNENWEFDAHGLMNRRFASINDLSIAEADRKLRWPVGTRPPEHAGLSDLGL